ncbi:hypothetical protein IJD44_07050 [bacterium]|nr:hypothetical protein [bacterium]
MKLVIASKSNEKEFNNAEIINIGTAPSCDFRLDKNELGFDLIFSVQAQADGKWLVVNTFNSDKLLFKGQPIGKNLEIGSLCKLMIAGTDEFVSIKSTVAGTMQKVVPGSLELANKRSAAKIKRVDNKKTMSVIEAEDINEQDIENLYGKGIGAQTKLKIDKRKADLEKRRSVIQKEISYKSNYLKDKLAQNEILLAVLNALIVFTPLFIVFILKDLYKIEVGASHKEVQTHIMFLGALVFMIITFLLKQGQFLLLQIKNNPRVQESTKQIKNLSLFASSGVFVCIIVFSIAELFFKTYNTPAITCQMMLLCSCICIFLGAFSGFIKNTNAETGEEFDSYQNREDFQGLIKDYQQWIVLFVNNISKKRLKDIDGHMFGLHLKSAVEYFVGVITAPFLAYGVSQTLAECFSEAAAWIRLSAGFKFSPIFLTLATLMIVFAFHCFATSFATTKRLHASNVIKEDGFSDYNVHGVNIYGVEASKNLKTEAKKFLTIAICVVAIEMIMNVSYFIGEMGRNIQGMILSMIAALVPTAILIMETTMLGNTKFEIISKEELLQKVDKNY